MDRESRVLIIGGGPMGQMHVITAKALGARKVLLSELDRKRRELALTLGADRTLNPGEGTMEETLLEETGGSGADICILCIGATRALKSAFPLVRKRGVISLFASFAPHEESPVDPNMIHYKELTLTGTHSTTVRQFRETVGFIDQSRIDLKKLITHQFPLDRINDAFEVYKNHEGLKVIVKPSAQ